MDCNNNDQVDSESRACPLTAGDTDTGEVHYATLPPTSSFDDVCNLVNSFRLLAASPSTTSLPSSDSIDDTHAEQFNPSISPEHQYLGDNLKMVTGRVILDEGSIVTIPLLPRSYNTLIPGQTFPLAVRDERRATLLRRCVESDHTFGCLATRFMFPSDKNQYYGTTAEIYEFSDDSETVCIKAKVRERFKVISIKRSDVGYYYARVLILPEIKLPKPLQEQMSRFAIPRQRERVKRNAAMMTPWPAWVHDQYNEDNLVQRVNSELSFLKQGAEDKDQDNAPMPSDPTHLSFWLASHLDDQERRFLIQINSPIHRLRWTLSLMSKCQGPQQYRCKTCHSPIACQSDVIIMSAEGVQGTYVNPHGFLHDTITFRKANNVTLVSVPTSQFSWFPGYAWSIAVCDACRQHIGWRFIAAQSRLRPQKFWGLSRLSIVTRVTLEDTCILPVM